jgi:hypothetical protein
MDGWAKGSDFGEGVFVCVGVWVGRGKHKYKPQCDAPRGALTRSDIDLFSHRAAHLLYFSGFASWQDRGTGSLRRQAICTVTALVAVRGVGVSADGCTPRLFFCSN